MKEERKSFVGKSVVSVLFFVFLLVNVMSAEEIIRPSEIYADVVWVATDNGFFVTYKSDPKRSRIELASILDGVIDLYEINTGQNTVLVVVFNGHQQQEFFIDEIGPFDIGTPKSISSTDWKIKKERARKFLNKNNLAKN